MTNKKGHPWSRQNKTHNKKKKEGTHHHSHAASVSQIFGSGRDDRCGKINVKHRGETELHTPVVLSKEGFPSIV